MKHSHLKAAKFVMSVSILCLSWAGVNAQAPSCNAGGSFGGATGGGGIELFCNTYPADIYSYSSQGITTTCRGCMAAGTVPWNHSDGWEKRGTAACTRFEKQMVIDFSAPVADVQLAVYGARTITDNRGYVVHLDPHLYPSGVPIIAILAFLPGSGISQITISDPVEYDAYAPGEWDMWLGTPSNFVYESTYIQCNCNRPTFARPASQSAFSPDWNGNGIPDWRMDVDVSDDDGLVLNNIRLENRYMAEQISVPYYYLDTNAINPTTGNNRGELKPDSGDPSMASRLVNYDAWNDDEKLVVEATYVIGQIPAGSTNCLEIVQRYEFYKSVPGDKCEPTATLPCARWKPIVSYKFRGPAGEFHNIEVAQRHHYHDNGFAENAVGLFRDCNYNPVLCLPLGGFIFTDKMNPLTYEYGSDVIRGGQDTGKWDNFHQTFLSEVDEPLINPGCPECVHMHWRWGAHLGGAFGSGKPLIAEGSNQDVDIGVVTFHAPVQPNPEDDPSDYRDLFQEPESTQTFQYVPDGSTYSTKSRDMVFWYSSTGYLPQNTFFPTKGAFFNPSYQGLTATITEGPPQGGAPAASGAKKSSVVPASPSSGDHPESIAFADLYEDGATTFSVIDPTTLGTLPNGYTLYDDDVYDVVTAATVSGPHVVTFSMPSVTDQAAFNNLRILHVEPDSFDPEKPRLVDRTILSPEAPTPDFINKKISARVNGLGRFLLATYTAQPPNTDLADLVVTVSDTPEPVVASNNLTYTVNITNNGPQTANEVMLKDSLAPEANFVSVTASQGTCRELDGSVLCSLDSFAANAAATITIVVTPNDGGTPFPPAGKVIRNIALIKANEGDANLVNNSFIESTTILPDPNAAPTINITSPTTGTLLVGPANLTVSATANDPDGSVNGVDYYDNGNLLGSATLIGANQYDFTWNNISFGSHIVSAIATDNLGKQRASDPVTIMVNGSAAVSVTSPGNWAVFNRPANIAITANASLSGGTISKVDFYEDGFLLGTGTLTGGTQYTFTRNAAPAGQHVITAVAIDGNGITTTSPPVNVIVNDPPVISLLAPTAGTVYTSAPTNTTVTANASDWDGGITQIDFYANGLYIGTNSSRGVSQFSVPWSNVAVGTYSLTAVARDIYGATRTSAPVTVRVNAPPTISMTSPANGATFTAPANMTLVATATDGDGTISNVDFFANNGRLGSGTAIGNNQYSFTWNNVGFGTYDISATATDNNGMSTPSGSSSITVKSPVLLVAGSTTLNTSDAAVKARLEALNHIVTVKDAASVTTADANGKALVVISSTVTPASVGTKFRTVTVPVITWESGLFTNMGMTGSTNKDFGTKTNQTQVAITNSSHPLAAGLSGTVAVLSAGKTFDWGKPNANAISIATVAGDATKTAIFAYEPGAVMPGLTAPARRLGMFLYDDTAASFNANGTALLDAAIKWARGGGSMTGSMVNSPVGSVNLTAEGVLDWAHWGRNGPTAFDHKGMVTQQITDITRIGTTSVGWFNDCPTAFTWTDGYPTLSVVSTPTGVDVGGVVGNGFQITVPANTSLRTLKLYVGVWYAQGKLEATLSDGSAPAFVDSSMNGNNGASSGLYTINFKAASSGQNLKIRFTILNQYFSPYGNVAWEAATLQ